MAGKPFGSLLGIGIYLDPFPVHFRYGLHRKYTIWLGLKLTNHIAALSILAYQIAGFKILIKTRCRSYDKNGNSNELLNLKLIDLV